jgi:hypothetical protein
MRYWHWQVLKLMINLELNIEQFGISVIIGWNQADFQLACLKLSLWLKTKEYDRLSDLYRE